MTNKEAIYCMRSYLGETDCVKCPYYASIPIDEQTSVCRSNEAHTLAIKALEERPTTTNKELKSIKPEDYRRSFTKALCGDCKYADVPRNRKPCCSCDWLERECYFEETEK